MGDGFGSEGRERSMLWGDDRLSSHSKWGGDVREGERKEPKEAGKAGPLLDVCTQDFSLGWLQCASTGLLSSHLSQPC